MKKILTLGMIKKDNKVLLGMKKRGFGAGRWNGFGGKLNEGESIEDAVKREVLEESGIIAGEIERLGILEFEFQGKPDEILEVHIFHCKNCSGEPTESDEMKPQWFLFDEIPFDTMWPDDIHWFPLFLSDQKFKGKFLFDPEGNVILEKILNKVEDFI